MSDAHRRYDNNGGSFVIGLLAGTALGVGLGMLFAPKSGKELRGQLSDQAGDLANTASEGYKRAAGVAGEWADKGREYFGKARDVAARGADGAEQFAREAARAVGTSLRS